MAPKPERLPPLHVVTDDEVAARADFLAVARSILAAGGGHVALHLRAPRASGRRLHQLAAELRRAAANAGAALIVSDRVDVALAVDADGVQLGLRSLGVEDARRLAGDRLIGASVHSVDEARAAGDADYLLAGSIFPTPSHPGRPGAGVGMIREMAASGRPVIAIGGITPERVEAVRAAGAAGMAVIRGVWDDPHPPAAVQRYLDAWQR